MSLGIEDEPLIVSLLKYRQNKNRVRVPVSEATLISSKTTDGRQKPIIDMDFKHHIDGDYLYLGTPSGGPLRSRVAIQLLHVTWRWVFRP